MAITQAILPVAGLGTRFLPWTKVVPKEMLPIGNRPIIAHIVDECLHAGITDICFIINRGKEMIPQYFYENPELEAELRRRGKEDALADLQKYDNANFHVVYQEEQLGDGHAILQAADWVKTDTVAILFGDDLFAGKRSGIAQLIDAFEQLSPDEQGAMVALQQIEKSMTGKYGIVDVESDHASIANVKKLKGMVEKPEPQDAPSDLGIVGRYLIPRSIFAVLPRIGASHSSTGLKAGSGEIRLIDALIDQLQTSHTHGLLCEGTRLDTGTPEGYAHAMSVLMATNDR